MIVDVHGGIERDEQRDLRHFPQVVPQDPHDGDCRTLSAIELGQHLVVDDMFLMFQLSSKRVGREE